MKENDFVKKIADKVKTVKSNKELRGEYMALLMREREIAQENFKRGLEEGIRRLCDSLKELGIDEEIIKSKLMNKYELTEEQAEKYLDK